MSLCVCVHEPAQLESLSDVGEGAHREELETAEIGAAQGGGGGDVRTVERAAHVAMPFPTKCTHTNLYAPCLCVVVRVCRSLVCVGPPAAASLAVVVGSRGPLADGTRMHPRLRDWPHRVENLPQSRHRNGVRLAQCTAHAGDDRGDLVNVSVRHSHLCARRARARVRVGRWVRWLWGRGRSLPPAPRACAYAASPRLMHR